MTFDRGPRAPSDDHHRSRRLVLVSLGAGLTCPAWAVDFPITPQQRATAQQIAQQGVPLSELAPNAPDSHTVRRGDTLWGISGMFLRRPWRWPELWGMNLDQIRNPHLIYPGQVLVLDKSGGRARLRLATPVGEPTNTVKLSPRVRAESLPDGAIAAIPLNLIGPFLNEAVVFDDSSLEQAPRIVATQEGRMLLGRGEVAYVRGAVANARTWRLFREPRALVDPVSGEVLGYEARFVGTAEFERAGQETAAADGVAGAIVPASFRITSVREEAAVGDRLAPTAAPELDAFVPRAPSTPVDGRVIGLYGDALRGGQNQIVALNRGRRDGIERGHVLGLWRSGQLTIDRTDATRPAMRLPDERNGLLFVFRVFERVSYALIVQSQGVTEAGDRFTPP